MHNVSSLLPTRVNHQRLHPNHLWQVDVTHTLKSGSLHWVHILLLPAVMKQLSMSLLTAWMPFVPLDAHGHLSLIMAQLI